MYVNFKKTYTLCIFPVENILANRCFAPYIVSAESMVGQHVATGILVYMYCHIYLTLNALYINEAVIDLYKVVFKLFFTEFKEEPADSA